MVPQDQVDGEFQFPFPREIHVAAIVEPENKSKDARNTMKFFMGFSLRGYTTKTFSARV